MQKEAISVYNPQDPIEKTVQDAYHATSNEWLDAAGCRSVAKAITSLKVFDEKWLDDIRLVEQRISYFFAPFMTQNKDTVIFVSHALFIRDIIENKEINSHLHSPVTFVTVPLAHYLLTEYPIHIKIDSHALKSANYKHHWIDVGGLLISESDVKLGSAIKEVSIRQEDPDLRKLINEVQGVNFQKAASIEMSPGVFHIDEHKRNIRPGDIVWDKEDRRQAQVHFVELGEVGEISVEYPDGKKKSFLKETFDRRFVVTEIV